MSILKLEGREAGCLGSNHNIIMSLKDKSSIVWELEESQAGCLRSKHNIIKSLKDKLSVVWELEGRRDTLALNIK